MSRQSSSQANAVRSGLEVEYFVYRSVNGRWLPMQPGVHPAGTEGELLTAMAEQATRGHSVRDARAAVAGLHAHRIGSAHGALNYDDHSYGYGIPAVLGGLPWDLTETELNTEKARLVTVMGEQGSVLAQNTYSGTHVHYRIEDDSLLADMVNQSRRFMWTLAPLFSNSAIHEGKVVRESSRRIKVSVGHPTFATAAPHYTDTAQYRSWRYRALDLNKLQRNLASEHSWVRENPERANGKSDDKPMTIEGRIFDAALTKDDLWLADTLGTAVFQWAEQRAIDGAGKDGLPEFTSDYASMAGLAAQADVRVDALDFEGKPFMLVHPEKYEVLPAVECIEYVLEEVRPFLERMGEWAAVKTMVDRMTGVDTSVTTWNGQFGARAGEIAGVGNGAARQKAIVQAVLSAEGRSEGHVAAIFDHGLYGAVIAPENRDRVLTNLMRYANSGKVTGEVEVSTGRLDLVSGLDRGDYSRIARAWRAAEAAFERDHRAAFVPVPGLEVEDTFGVSKGAGAGIGAGVEAGR